MSPCARQPEAGLSLEARALAGVFMTGIENEMLLGARMTCEVLHKKRLRLAHAVLYGVKS